MTVLENDSGVPSFDEEKIAVVICDYYKKLFTSSPTEDLHIVDEALQPCVSHQVNEAFIKDLTPE